MNRVLIQKKITLFLSHTLQYIERLVFHCKIDLDVMLAIKKLNRVSVNPLLPGATQGTLWVQFYTHFKTTKHLTRETKATLS